MSKPKYIVVVGASAGGLNCVIELAAQLTEDVDAAVFVLLHITHLSLADVLIARIQKSTPFHCKIVEEGEKIKRGYLYVAIPDKHLLLKDDHIVLGGGTPENRWRPSIDILFRSAAAAYSQRVIGIILSGLMEDGTAGMIAIKKSGGTCIVQDPEEAEYPDMPKSVLNHVKVDYCVSLAAMGAILAEKTKNGKDEVVPAPPEVLAEAAIAERIAVRISDLKQLGEKSDYSCPDCGGGLYEMKGEFSRYRCHTGHVYAQHELELRQNQALENTLWIALRMMEERRNLLIKMSEEEKSKGWLRNAESKIERATDLRDHIERLKQLLFSGQDD